MYRNRKYRSGPPNQLSTSQNAKTQEEHVTGDHTEPAAKV